MQKALALPMKCQSLHWHDDEMFFYTYLIVGWWNFSIDVIIQMADMEVWF